jgi:cobaltochelatase CobN
MRLDHVEWRSWIVLGALLVAGLAPRAEGQSVGPAAQREAEPVRVLYVFSDGQMPVTLDAYKALLAEHPELRDRVDLRFLTESVFDDVEAEDAVSADVVVLDVMNQQMVDRFDAAHDTNLIEDVAKHGKVIGVGEGLVPKDTYVEQGVIWDGKARALWADSGRENQLGLLKFALGEAGVSGLEVPDPEPSLELGYYYPDADGGRVFADWTSFDAWRREHGKLVPGASRVAIGFYKSSYYTGDMSAIDALIAEVERQGAEAIPLFGYPGGVAYERLLLDPNGKSRADVGLGLLFRFSGPEAAGSLGKLDIPVINLVTLYGRSEEQWRQSATGLSMFEGTFQVAVPELGGLIAPTVVGSREKVLDLQTGLSVVQSRPIRSRVTMAVARALRYAALRAKPNADKRLALMYYNYPPGKASIGASYLNVAESLAAILARLEAEGYDLGNADLSAEAVLEDITNKAHNVGSYAPGELAAMVGAGNAVRISLAQYSQWLGALAPPLRAKILADWGPPGEAKLMAEPENGEDGFVIPQVRFGNVVLLPQPARGWGEDQEKLYHAKDLAPHHQYVATYAWIREGFQADAIVHLGTHGTLEWLDGKDVGQNEEDASDALLAALPDIYIYNVDVVGEGLVARRRGLATLVDHMVPPFTSGGLYPELAALEESIDDLDQNLHKNPELAKAFADQVREQVIALGIAKDLGLDLWSTGSLDDPTVHKIRDYVLGLKGENIPYGMHTFGRVPDDAARASTVEAIVSTDRSLMPNDAKVLAADIDARIVRSGARELASLARALNGGFVPVGGGGEPIRNPDAYPTGKNFYGIDPDKVPKRAAWALGAKLADDLLAQHLAEHGAYPQKVSFVIWGDETMRHEGVLESEIFWLLGTRPVWNDRDKVVDVEIVPSSELNRPRVDIVIASAAEGMFNNVTLLMDKAVQEVKQLEEAENYVRRHYLATRQTLIDRGYSPAEADKRAGVRIFDEPPGTFNLNTSNIAAASGTWDSDRGMGDDYLKKMGHGFGNGFWGEPMEDVFRLALTGTEKIVHSSSTMLYGALDNDDFYMYMGGLANAVRSVDGTSPDLVVANTRDPSQPKNSSVDEFIGAEFRSRYVNPKWIEGMKEEGYAGAGAMREFVEYLWGWDATVSSTVDDAMWKETFDVYVADKYGLDMQQFFDEKSPFAFQDMAARMLETVRKGYWQADQETQKRLLTEYIESVKRHGIGCSDVTCGNARLLEFIATEAREVGVPVPDVEQFEAAAEQALGAPIAELAAAARRFAIDNEARIANRQVPGPEAVPTEQSVDQAELKGYLMRNVNERDRSGTETSQTAPTGPMEMQPILVAFALLGALLLWRWRRHAA